MEKLSILIPIHNGIENTKQCLSSLSTCIDFFAKQANNLNYSFEVIIIDDGSTDQSAEWVAYHYPSISILRGDGNLWWSGAINLGAKFAIETQNADYILLWNNDVFAKNDYLVNLVDNIINFPEIKIFGSLVYIANSNKIHSFGGYNNKKFGIRGAYQSAENNVLFKMVDWLPGMGTTIQKNVIIDVNYWDSITFPQYMGDSDFILRASKYSYKAFAFSNLILENNISSTGIHANTDLQSFIKSFYSIRSMYNIKDNFNFFLRHHCSLLASYGYLSKYLIYIMSFLKRTLY